MKIYKYDNIEYKSEAQVRKAIWHKERKAFAKCSTAEDWAKHGVEYSEVEPVVTEAQLASQARAKRDHLLNASDYYMMSDYPSTEEGLVAVKAYRQALRDITAQEDFPSEIVWPVKPEVL